MTKFKLSAQELTEHLKEHVDWLEESMRSFDGGKDHAAKRLAHTMRSLLHETSVSHALLSQLGLRDTLRYWSVLPDFGDTSIQFVGVGMQLGPTMGYAPNLTPPEQRMPFDRWWNQEEIIVSDGQIVTRRRAVLYLANKGGGSHVDPALTELEHRMLNTDFTGGMPFTLTGGQTTVVHEETVQTGDESVTFGIVRIEGGEMKEEPPMRSPISAVVRQVAHELYGTLREQVPL